MTFTYIEATLATVPRDAIRFHIADTVEDQGPRPDGRNFSNVEIAFLLSEEGDRVNGAIAKGFEVLATEWTAFALAEKEGEVDWDLKEVAENFRKQAAFWRKKPGGGSEAERSGGLVTLERVDAYT